MTPFKQTGFPAKGDKPKHIFTQFQVTCPFSLYSSFSKMQTKTGKVEVAEREHMLVGHHLNRQMEVNLLTNAFAHTVYFVCWDQYNPY